MSTAALLAPLCALFIGVASLAALLGSAFGLSRALERHLARRSTTAHAAATFAPVWMGLLACAAIASPNPFTGCHCATDLLAHCHLCAEHPAFAMELLAPALYVLAAWLVVVGPRLARLARELVASLRWSRSLRRALEVRVDGIPVRLVDCGSRTAFTTGIITPFIVVDRALWAILDADERRAVVHHEHAHVVRRDVLTLALLRLASAVSVVPLAAPFVARWKRAAEMRCDLHAARQIGDATRVAAALIAVERARDHEQSGPEQLPLPMLGVAAGIELEARILALLAEPEVSRPRSLRSDAIAIGIALVGLTTLVVLWPGDSFHHAAETLIDWLSHPH